MYELTCPSCSDRTQHTFVRLSAVTRCPKCDNVYRISSSHMKGPIRPENLEAIAADHAMISKAASEESGEDLMGGSSLTGLSGLSQLMQDEPAVSGTQIMDSIDASPDKSDDSLSEIPDVGQGVPPSAIRKGVPRDDATKYLQQRRLKRIALLTVALLALLVGMVGVGLMLAGAFVSSDKTDQGYEDTPDVPGPEIEEPEVVEPKIEEPAIDEPEFEESESEDAEFEPPNATESFDSFDMSGMDDVPGELPDDDEAF